MGKIAEYQIYGITEIKHYEYKKFLRKNKIFTGIQISNEE